MAGKKDTETAQEVGTGAAFPGDDSIAATGTAVGQAQSTAVSTDVMSFEEDGGAEFSMADVSIPFFVVLQALSPQLDKQNPAFMKDAEAGDILNTATGDLWKGEDGMPFLVITHQRRFTEWWPRNSKKGKGLVNDFGTDAEFAKNKVINLQDYPWMTKDETSIIEAGVYYILALTKSGMPQRGVLNLQGTQLKKYKQLNTMMQSWMLRSLKTGRPYNPPTFARVYMLTTVPERNDQGNWYGMKFVPGPALGKTGDDFLDANLVPNGGELYKLAKDFKEQISAGDVIVAQPVSEAEAAGPAADADIPF
jgi:hypothetical protein